MGSTRRCIARLGAPVAAGVAFAVLGVSGVASAATPVPPGSFYSLLWVAPAAGGVFALAVVILAARHSHSWRWSTRAMRVRSVSAWDFKDSWVTNLTALGTVLTAIFTQSSATDFLVNSPDKDGFTVMSLLFGGAAVMAPIIYGTFPPLECKGGIGDAPPTGSRQGLLLATMATLFATFGLLSNIGLFVSDTRSTFTEQVLIYIGLGVSAIIVALYAIRSTTAMVSGRSLVTDNPAGAL